MIPMGIGVVSKFRLATGPAGSRRHSYALIWIRFYCAGGEFAV